MGYERNDRRFGSSSDRYGSAGYGNERGRYGASGGQDYRRDDDRSRAYGDPRADREPYRGDRARWDADERGFFDRAGDEVRSWFGDEDAERRRRLDERDAERDDRRGYGSAGYRPAADYGDVGYAAAAGGYGGAEFVPGYAPRERARTDPRDHDHGYRSWRDRQMEAFDRDYADYRRENQSRFESDFGNWRQNRERQRGSLGQVREHQEVVGSDGGHVGTVDRVEGDRILLTKADKDAGGRHHSFPSSWIRNVGDKVEISRTAEQAQSAWREEQDREQGANRGDGPHVLNRSFSGTY